MSKSNKGNSSAVLFQPIWKAAPGRRKAAIIALIGMAVITLAAFFPAYGRSGDAATNLAVSALNIVGGLFGADLNLSTSFTLFEACRTNMILLILFEVALALGFIFPLVTETELEMIPAALLSGIHIYIFLNISEIYSGADSSGIAALTELGGGTASVSFLTLGFILELVGLVLLVISIILHFKKGSAAAGAAHSNQGGSSRRNRDDRYSGNINDRYDSSAGTAGGHGAGSGNGGASYGAAAGADAGGGSRSNAEAAGRASNGAADANLYGGNPDAETYMMGNDPGQGVGPGFGSAADTAQTVPLRQNQPVAVLHRMNTGENLLIYEGESVIGRKPQKSQIIVSSAAVSGAHARLSAYRGGCSVTDLSSTNGTFINGNRIEPNVRAQLRDGDYLSLGAEILEFRLMN